MPAGRWRTSKRPFRFNDKRDEAAGGCLAGLGEFGELFLQILFARDAELVHRATGAIWRTRRAEERAEFHERLVQSRTVSQNRLRGSPMVNRH